jgi:Fe-S-cluster formation regulator IscX/YfhJ
MTSEDFLAQFIDSCIAKGYASPAAMCQEAQAEIDTIEEKLKEIEPLRIRQSNLRQIIRQFGGGTETKRAKKAPMVVDLSQENLDPNLQEICGKICDLIAEKDPELLNPYQIRDAVVTLENNRIAYAAIKSLWDRGIIQRLEQDNQVLITKGPKWNERPTATGEEVS